MPCPFFEPRAITARATYRNGRLPLLDEYDGLCHLNPNGPLPAHPSVRFSGCNHGNVSGVCTEVKQHSALAAERRPILRFSLARREAAAVQVVVIEERDFAPVRSHTVTFRPAFESFEPELPDRCRRAQLLAFCRSYLARYPL